jgi:hypothetical protein
MNTQTEKLYTKATKTVKEQLAERASPSCRRCFGRGHLGINIDTDRYIICRCVKRAAQAAQAKQSDGPKHEVDRLLAEAARKRLAQNEQHLNRLHEAIAKAKQEEEAASKTVSVANEMSDEEEAVQAEAEFERLRIAKMRESARDYTNLSIALDDEAETLTEFAAVLRSVAAEVVKESGRLRALSELRLRESCTMAIKADAEESVVRVRVLAVADRLASQRSTKVHKLEKKRREIQGRIEKLTVRAGKVQVEIEKDRAIGDD